MESTQTEKKVLKQSFVSDIIPPDCIMTNLSEFVNHLKNLKTKIEGVFFFYKVTNTCTVPITVLSITCLLTCDLKQFDTSLVS